MIDPQVQTEIAKMKQENRLKRVPGARKLARLLGLLPAQRNHREFLLNMLPKNSIGEEIGVHEGHFSAEILQTVNPRELHLIDPWKHEVADAYKDALYGGKAQNGQAAMDDRYHSVQPRFGADIRSGRVKIHREYSTPALARFPDGYFDWIYIDGNHLYEYVQKDLALSFRKIKPGGYIAGDDYEADGWWRGGVKKAVDEFVQAATVELLTVHNDQFLLRR
jgi:hypothetical protein